MTPLYLLEEVVQVRDGREVLRIDRLEALQGECLALTGPNGSGKSTLLRILSFLDAPASGRLVFRGRDVHGVHHLLRREAVLLDQNPCLLRRTVAGNVAFGLRARGQRRCDERVAAALEMVGLAPDRFASRPAWQLSGGEARRVALAARLALEPRVLLLDEPTANLDAPSAAGMLQALRQAQARWGSAILVASHDEPWLEALSGRVIRLRHGRLAG